ncbi:hypothetical protein FA10DRAFT_300540 [Acaromyces ingoldii]|uniref:Uncharacterized protein n=1 Tax=Acaromyces ingoldii TaxID=215250 RepID=A0A316YRQ7_9BASI|nr:hypothetical protein FA10DRAFT_300540 [Acaromyces ingoldii]PWN91989.1 hypothetical protein FA10DRAFT_300540 [Acaromyces ingoldii]
MLARTVGSQLRTAGRALRPELALQSRIAAARTPVAAPSRGFGWSPCAHAKKRDSRAASKEEDDDAFIDVEAEDEGDLFSVSDSVSTSGPVESTLPTRETFRQSYNELAPQVEAKLIAMAEGSTNEPPRLSAFRNLSGAASSIDELRNCLSIAARWNDLGERRRLGIHKLNVVDGRVFARQALKQGLPELALYAALHRAKTGLDYDLALLRMIQTGLVTKLVRTSQLPQEEAKVVFLESEQIEGTVETREPWMGAQSAASGEGESEGEAGENQREATTTGEDVDAQRGLLSLIDRTLVLTSATSAFSRKGLVDIYCLMLSIDAHLQPVQPQEPTAFNTEQVRPRLERAIDVLLSTMSQTDPTTLQRLNSLTDTQRLSLGEALQSLSTYTSQDADVLSVLKQIKAANDEASAASAAAKVAKAEAEAAAAAAAAEAEEKARKAASALSQSQSEREWLGKKDEFRV